MQNPTPPAVYRIRGYSESPISKPKPDRTPHEAKHPDALLGQVFRAVGGAHITDTLYHPKVLNRLSSHLPTFAYVRPRKRPTALKEAPVRLIEYLDYSSEDDVTQKIIQTYERQQTEVAAIELLLADVNEGCEPAMSVSPLALALACHLLRGNPWLQKNKQKILETITQSSAASYVALSSGFYQHGGESQDLWDKVGEDPKLVLEAWQNPVLRRDPQNEWFHKSLQSHPVHQALQHFLAGTSEDALEILHKSAATNPICAGISLGLQPNDPKANDWLAVARREIEAVYWSQKIWKAGGHDISTHPHATVALSDLRRDPRWHYLWLLEAQGPDLIEGAKELGISLWTAELIVDRELTQSLVIELFGDGTTLDPQNAIESALLLWASDYTSPSSTEA